MYSHLSLLPTGYDLSQDVIERSSGMLHLQHFYFFEMSSMTVLFPFFLVPQMKTTHPSYFHGYFHLHSGPILSNSAWHALTGFAFKTE